MSTAPATSANDAVLLVSPPHEDVSSQSSSPPAPPSKFSVFADGITKVCDVPMSVIIRPLPSELDETKVQAFMNDLESDDQFTPIEVLRVRDPKSSGSYYFSLGGCHRYEAHKRLGRETIPGKVVDVPAKVMRGYLGAGSPF